jgi:hypothetical protein
MADRRPLVAVSGTPAELPVGDRIVGHIRTVALCLCAGFNPTSTGGDVVELPAPYDYDGTTSITWDIVRIDFTLDAAPSVNQSLTIEKSSSVGATPDTTVGSVTVLSGAKSASNTTGLGTAVSGTKFRFNTTAIQDGTGWTVVVYLSK